MRVQAENARSMSISNRDGYAYTAPVGSYRPNAFHLYDMHGNVTEWCADWYAADYYSGSPTDDPQGPPSGEFRNFRGGGWHSTPGFFRMSNRGRHPPTRFNNKLGFRVVRELPASD
jgi:formylglycine-generating enzyme required for sulfatase activity